MGLITIIGLILIAAFLAVLLKPYRAEYALALSLLAGVIILAFLLDGSSDTFASLRILVQQSAFSTELAGVLLRALGICLMTQMASDACKDVGETALAAKAELAGKCFLLTLALPLLENMAQIIGSLLNRT